MLSSKRGSLQGAVKAARIEFWLALLFVAVFTSLGLLEIHLRDRMQSEEIKLWDSHSRWLAICGSDETCRKSVDDTFWPVRQFAASYR